VSPFVGSLTPRDTPVPIAEVHTDEWQPRPTGLAEMDRVLSGASCAARSRCWRRARYRQVDDPPAGGHRRCRVAVRQPSHLRRGIEATGAPAGRAAGHAATEVVARLRNRAPTRDDPPRRRQTRGARDRFDPDHVRADLSSAPGSVGQVRECAPGSCAKRKTRTISTILVGHVTKDGSLAGPRVLRTPRRHRLSFRGRASPCVTHARAVKHRFGATDRAGVCSR